MPFPLASYVANNPILHLIIYIQLRSIPFLSISRDHLPYAEHIGDHLPFVAAIIMTKSHPSSMVIPFPIVTSGLISVKKKNPKVSGR